MALKQTYLIPVAADYTADPDDFVARVVTRSDPTNTTGLTNDTPYGVLKSALLTGSYQTFTPTASAGFADNGVVFDSTQYLDRAQVMSDGTQALTFFLDCIPASGTGIQHYVTGYESGLGVGLSGLVERGSERAGLIAESSSEATIGSDLRLATWTNATRYRAIASFQKIGSDYKLRGASRVGTGSWANATDTDIIAPVDTPYFGVATRLFAVADMTVFRVAVSRSFIDPHDTATKALLVESDGTTLPDVTALQTAAGANLLFDMYGDATGWETPKAGNWGAFTLTGSLSNAP